MTIVGGRPVLMSGTTMTAETVAQIKAEAMWLRRYLIGAPDERKAILVELAKMMASFPMQEQGAGAAGARADAYLEALGNSPAWAVREARLRVLRGETDLDQRYAPTPPQLASEVRRILEPFRDDLADLEKLQIAAPIGAGDYEPSPEERARVKQTWDTLRPHFAVGEDDRKKQRREFRDDLFAKGNAAVARREAASRAKSGSRLLEGLDAEGDSAAGERDVDRDW